jgi:hypothetical protein
MPSFQTLNCATLGTNGEKLDGYTLLLQKGELKIEKYSKFN